jgi:hypothetical protein
MQVAQGVRRDARGSERHRGANPGVEHPLGKRCYDTRFDLNMDDATASTLLAVVSSHALTMERMPTVVNLNFPLDMGRMTA